MSERADRISAVVNVLRGMVKDAPVLFGVRKDEIACLEEAADLLSALPPVRAQEPTDRLCDCGHRESEHDDDYGQPCRRCSCINPRYGAETFEAVLNEAERVRAALPPVQATTAEAEPRYCQKCGSNAIRTVEPGLFVCDWCDAVMRDKSSPLRETPAPSATDTECPPDCHCRKETPAPDLARVRALREIIERMRNEGPRYKSHDLGYIDSVSASNVDEWADELEALAAALEGATPSQETK